jgi:hypothetical protein
MFVAMRHGYALAFAASLLGCGGSHTSPQSPGEAPRTVAANSAATTSPAPSTVPSTPVTAPSASSAPAPAKTSDLPPTTISTAKAHTDGKHYALDARAPGSVSVGGTGELEIVLLAKDGYHINDEFPYKLRTEVEPAGTVTFEKAEYTRTQGSYTKTEARFKAKFAGAKTGDAKIGGVIALSVCTQKECVTDKVQLEVPITVR